MPETHLAHSEALAEVWLGDSRHLPFDDESIDLIITSPPYFGLRSYAEGAELMWADGWVGQLGLEPTVELHLAHLNEIWQECWRVLKPWGTLVVNYGDSQAGANYRGGGPESASGKQISNSGTVAHMATQAEIPIGYKPLDMMGMPFRVAFDLQARGWYWRRVMPWIKESAMPESIGGHHWERHRVKVASQQPGKSPQRVGVAEALGVKAQRDAPGGNWQGGAQWADCPGCPKCTPNDGLVFSPGNWRPSRAHEYIMVFAKRPPSYGDGEAVRIASITGNDRVDTITTVGSMGAGAGAELSGRRKELDAKGSYQVRNNPAGRNRRDTDWWLESLDAIIAERRKELAELTNIRDNGGALLDADGEPMALLVNPKGYKGAHYATFPIAMVEPLIRAYTSERGNCPKCGRPWARVIASSQTKQRGDRSARAVAMGHSPTGPTAYGDVYPPDTTTLGWRPHDDCHCDAGEPVPAVVLDPFGGTATVAMAARKLGRKGICVEVAPKYVELAIRRLKALPPPEEKAEMEQAGLW